MNSLVDVQIQHNQASRDCWDAFAPHRREITRQLIHGPICKATRICVMGAGNCNDLDLEILVNTFQEIHLIDLDGQSLRAGVARQKVAGYPGIYLYEDVDVTGVFHLLAKWAPDKQPNDIELNTCIQEAAKPSLDVPAPFDVVASICLLSQLIEATVLTLGPDHPRLLDLILGIRNGHLGLMTELVAPGGIGLLVTDIVSSTTVPNLLSFTEAEFTSTLVHLIKNRNFFTGLNPFAISTALQKDPTIAPLIARLQLAQQWRWNLGKRAFAICAIKFQKTKYKR